MKHLIKTIFLIFLAGSIAIPTLAQSEKNQIGMVSFTYRHSFDKDVAQTLDTIQQLGITDMEFSNLFGTTAEELRAMLDERGMHCSSYGVSYDALVNDTDRVAREAKVLGADFVRVAWIPHEDGFTFEHVKQAAEDFNRAGKVLQEEHGLTFCYHNHGYEFQPYEEGTYYDYLVENTDPENVSYEMDVLWVVHPGADPVALLKKYGDRFKLMHMKDLKKGVEGDFSGGTSKENDVVLGTGQMDFPAITEAASQAGVQHFYIEDESPTASTQVPQSIDFLESLGYEK